MKKLLGIVVCLLLVVVGYTFVQKKQDNNNQKEPEQSIVTKHYDTIVPIITELTYFYQNKGWVWDEEKSFSIIIHGTGFLVGDKIVTARHVVAGSRIDKIRSIEGISFDKKSNELKKLLVRIRISGKGIVPKKIFVDDKKDLAFLTLSQEDMNTFLSPSTHGLDGINLKRLSLAQIIPSVEQKVKAWGFPSTAVPQLKSDLKITSVKKDWFVLNKSLDPGYSGGPVITNQGQILGVISRSQKQQSRIVRISTQELSTSLFQDYHDGIVLAEKS